MKGRGLELIRNKRSLLPMRRRRITFSTVPVAVGRKKRCERKNSNNEPNRKNTELRSAVVTAVLSVILFANGFQAIFGREKAVDAFAPIREIHEYFDETVRENDAAAAFFWGGSHDQQPHFS